MKAFPFLIFNNNDMTSFPQLQAAELHSAQSHHPPLKSAHEGYAVILEELDEVWALVKLKESKRDYIKLRAELVQVAAMAQRMAEECCGPLVPAIEVERAWHEAFVVGATRPVSPDDEWRRSRARRVVEGGEA